MKLVLALILLATPAFAQDRSEEAAALIGQAEAFARQGAEDAAIELLERAEPLTAGDGPLEVRLGKAFESAHLPKRAAAAYMRAALAEGQVLASAAAALELSRLAETLSLPKSYAGYMDSGSYAAARDAAPWWPAAYWALAMQARLDGKRNDAHLLFRQFDVALRACGLEGPLRDWAIQARQMREQVGVVETKFLADAGFLTKDWARRVREGTGSEIAAAFGAVDSEVWSAAGAAARRAMRFKTLSVPGDYASVQAAVDALTKAGGGGAIELAPGTYRESVTIQETARVIVRSPEPGRARLVSGSGPALRILGGSDLVVDGVTLESEASGPALELSRAARVTLRRVTAAGAQDGLWARDVSELYLWAVAASGKRTGASFERGDRLEWVSGSARGGSAPAIELSATKASFDGLDVSGERDGIAVFGGRLDLRRSRLEGLPGSAVSASGGAGLEVAACEISTAAFGVSFKAATGKVSGTSFRRAVVGVSAVERSTVRVERSHIIEGETGFQAERSSVAVVGSFFRYQAGNAVLLSEPDRGFQVSGNDVDSAAAAVVLAGARGGGLVSGNLITDCENGIVVGPSPGAEPIRLSGNTIAHTEKAALWAAPGAPEIALDGTIMAFGGGGVLDHGNRVRAARSVVFGSEHWDVDPATAAARLALERIDPGFFDQDSDDFRLGASSPLKGRAIGARPD